MQRLFLVLFLGCFFAACSSKKYDNPHVIIKTTYGEIELEVYTKNAPISANAFLKYVAQGLYNNTSFYRVLNDDNQPMGADAAHVIQGGLFATKNTTNVPNLPHETTKQTGILHQTGTVSLARLAPGTASTEFFICLGNHPNYDYDSTKPNGQGYASFAKVVNGIQVVRKINTQPSNGEQLQPPVAIKSIKIL
jgi:peptidyl-prolyl cis-trans isomerase A (cyclophilin A)